MEAYYRNVDGNRENLRKSMIRSPLSKGII